MSITKSDLFRKKRGRDIFSSDFRNLISDFWNLIYDLQSAFFIGSYFWKNQAKEAKINEMAQLKTDAAIEITKVEKARKPKMLQRL